MTIRMFKHLLNKKPNLSVEINHKLRSESMFNSYNPTQKVNVNSVSGTLSKTCKDSYFQFH